MDEIGVRVLVLLNVVVPLLVFMAWVYLLLHVVFERLMSPESPVLWFFRVVTGPLTHPVRRRLATGTPERRVRTVALVAYFTLWVVVRAIFAQLMRMGAG